MEGIRHGAPSPFDSHRYAALGVDDGTLTGLYAPPSTVEEQTGARRAPSARLRVLFEEVGDRALALTARGTALIAALCDEPPTFRRIDAFFIAVASGVLSVIGIMAVIALFG